MAQREILLPWLQQPQEAVGVNWDDPLSLGLVASFNFSDGLRDAVTGRFAENKGVVPAVSSVGQGITAATAGISVPWDLGITTEDLTITIVEYRTVAPTGYWMVADNRNSGVGYIYGFDTTAYNPSGLLTLPGYKVTSFCKSEWYQNKVKTSAAIGTGLVPVANLRLFGRYTDADPYGNSVICACYIHKRNIAADEHAAIFDAPWRLFAPQSIWVPVSAGGGPTPVGLSAETDASLSLPAVQIKALGRADETDTAIALPAVQVAATGVAVEVDSAFALAAVQLQSVGLATETDTALALAAGSANAAGLAEETDSAIALAGVQITATGIALETDAALALTGIAGTAPGVAAETDAALALAAVQKLVAGAALEVDTALALSAPGGTLDLILKILVNRQELNPATGTFTLYDDDGTTVLYTTSAWADAAGTVPYSGGALRRIDALF